MLHATWIALPERGVVVVEGTDAKDFLQGLVTNDVALLSPSRAVYAALLTAQGGFLHDFLMIERDGAVLLDCDARRIPELVGRLGIYRLRADVRIEDARGGWRTLALLPASGEPGAAGPWHGGVLFSDPRHPGLGDRAVVPAGAVTDGDFPRARRGTPERYEGMRIALGVPDGAEDLAAGRERPLEGGLDVLGGVSFDKGCYVGQEVTARMKHRGLVRRRLVPVSFDGPAPAPGTPVARDGVTVGEIRSGVPGRALAMLRLDGLESGALAADGRKITPGRPL